MNTSRRSFIKGLAALPFVGSWFALDQNIGLPPQTAQEYLKEKLPDRYQAGMDLGVPGGDKSVLYWIKAQENHPLIEKEGTVIYNTINGNCYIMSNYEWKLISAPRYAGQGLTNDT